MNFEIGSKVSWSIGKGERTIKSRGLYLSQSEQDPSKSIVMMYEHKNIACTNKLEVLTSLLEEDN